MKYFSKKIINQAQLIKNYNNLKDISNKKICAVVKANAYGHNSKTVCKILENDCNFFAVQNLYEALKIRKINNTAKILVLGYCINYKKASEKNIDVTIDSITELNKIIKMKKRINIHLKINTGMNRLGIKSFELLNKILKLLECNKEIRLAGVYTHFFNANNLQITEAQMKLFLQYLKKIKKIFNPIVHIGGSGMINYTNLDFVDYIRCGLALYGYGCKFTKPIMKIESKLIKITYVKKDEYIGYDGFYKSDRNMKIGLIPLGYGDGIVRQFQDKMFVLYKNQKIRVVGKICMDMLMVDITGIKVKINDIFQVFYDAKYWAENSLLSEYEILTGLNNSRTDLVIK